MNRERGGPSEFQIEPGARDLLANEQGHRCGRGMSAGGVEWLRDEQRGTPENRIGPKQWFCLFHADAGPMAVSVDSVAEVLETDTLVRLAWSPPRVIGMCSYHREVVPVVVLGPVPTGPGDDSEREPAQAAATDPVLEKPGIGDRPRCVVLILRTEQGVWGIRVDSENTMMSRESPEYHSPRDYASGPVLIGIIRLEGTCYRILDAEATWHGLRSALGQWSGLISESKSPSPPPSGEERIRAGGGVSWERCEA
jgi:chemotaxis signal transduction protein